MKIRGLNFESESKEQHLGTIFWIFILLIDNLNHDQIRQTAHQTRPLLPSLCEHHIPSLQNQLYVCRYFSHYSEKVFPLPQIADSITEGTIAEFTKKEGEWVELD